MTRAPQKTGAAPAVDLTAAGVIVWVSVETGAALLAKLRARRSAN
jgi:hypothetical protein